MTPGQPFLCFDADDTLWHNEDAFAEAHRKFAALLADYHAPETVESTLYATEKRNIPIYGYGCKGFTLSALETAVELAGDTMSSREVRALLTICREMLLEPVRLLPGVEETLRHLAARHPLALLTKGDLAHQENKLRASGLMDLFTRHAVISEKDEETYRRMLVLWGVEPSDFVMIGNSIKSDILPVLALGGRAIHIPYPLTWQHERAEVPENHPRFTLLDSMARLPAWVDAYLASAAKR
jgi:putative hydrolase of the HAD superfamily